jgi:hypothetical protein
MPAQATKHAQVNGHRFLLLRLEHALIRGDSRMIHDPMRSQVRALIGGAGGGWTWQYPAGGSRHRVPMGPE